MNYRQTPFIAILFVLLAVSLSPTVILAQTLQTTRYIYDANGRLRAVVAPSGEAAVYDYDPAGNITAIRRLTDGALEFLSFSPSVGLPQNLVTLYGVGIGTGLISVSFNGVPARVVSSSPIGIVVEVPATATTGPITIVTARGSVTTPPFTVRGVGLVPTTATIDATDQLQFRAFVSNATGNQAVQWSVNGIAGGDATVGTITSSGLYSAPLLPNNVERRNFTIRAVSVSDPDLSREVTITVRGLNGVLGLVAQPLVVYLTPSGALTTSTLQPAATGVSVYLTPTGALTTSTLQPTAEGLSVYLTPAGALTISTLQPAAEAVSVTTGPLITSVSPVNVPRGGSANITVNGANLTGVTRLVVLQSNYTTDPNVTVTNLTINPSGTSLTATISANANAALGQRWFVVATDAASSPAFAAVQVVAP